MCNETSVQCGQPRGDPTRDGWDRSQFNQFLVQAEEPLLYHTGMRQLFPLVKDAVERLIPIERLRWIAFAHVEADECGAVNQFLTVAPRAQVAHGALGCTVSLNDLCDRPPRPLAEGDVLDVGGATLRRRLVEVPTPHVPHNWESHVLFEESLERSSAVICARRWAMGQR